MKRIRTIETLIVMLSAVCVFAQTEIRTADELAAMCKDETSRWGSYILLNDITVENWKPVGSSDTPFEGLFNGSGHTVTVKSIVQGETEGKLLDYTPQGLFAVIGKNGSVKNLKIEGEIDCNSGTLTLYAGAVAGKNYGMIMNCVSCCNITVKGGKINFLNIQATRALGALATGGKMVLYTNGAYAGGLAGINSGEIKNCHSSSNIYIDGEGIKCGGGIAGGSGSDAGGIVAQCIATGTVTTTGKGGAGTKGYYRGAGGIAGQNCGVIKNCVALNKALTASHVKCVAGINAMFDAETQKGDIDDSFYQKEITVFKSTDAEKKDEKTAKKVETGKGMEGSPVEIIETQTQEWWQSPKGKKSKFAFAFGSDDNAPWTWNEALQRPVLYWEITEKNETKNE
ncbi:MAG: hypothetical protein LBG92_08310 [Prevotellaceae bacterium]|jgi:hypothetical protein|nr:hypothetical protein [Prevotellaceae bacterium]